MPMTKMGQKIMANMMKQYHSEKKAKQVFHAMENAGKLPKGAVKKGKSKRRKRSKRSRRK